MENKPILLGDKEVDLNKIFTPAPDAEEHIIKKDRKFGEFLRNFIIALTIVFVKSVISTTKTDFLVSNFLSQVFDSENCL